MNDRPLKRREFLKLGAGIAGAVSLGGADATGRNSEPTNNSNLTALPKSYEAERLAEIAFPMGGIGAGMICLEGAGALSHFSLRHVPDLAKEPRVFAAVAIKGANEPCRVLEGPVPPWKLARCDPGSLTSACWGLPRFGKAAFSCRFPFATVRLEDPEVPLEISLTGWSPFCPGDVDNSSLPVAAIDYFFKNNGSGPLAATFSFSSENFMAGRLNAGTLHQFSDFFARWKGPDRIFPTKGGFVLHGAGGEGHLETQGSFAVWIDDPRVVVDHAWFQGGFLWLDSLAVLWRDLQSGHCIARAPCSDASATGATLFLPVSLAPGETRRITLKLAWFVPESNLFEPQSVFRDGRMVPAERPTETYRPWYATRFRTFDQLVRYWETRCEHLRQTTETFTEAFYDSTLPSEVLEAVGANLAILKSPTILRQADGRLWGWEGSGKSGGAGGRGTTTHVWNYAQSIAHLFPDLERGLRETELGPDLDSDGKQAFRAVLPIRPISETEEGFAGLCPAADGQLGGILKAYREWRIGGETEWLTRWWPNIRSSLEFCIRTWDPAKRGWIQQPHHTTYDSEFVGPEPMCTSLYAAALKAAILMADALGEPAAQYAELLEAAGQRMEELFNGEYFQQSIEFPDHRVVFPGAGLGARTWARLNPATADEARLEAREGPKYQFGSGCLSAGLLGQWLGWACGVGEVLDERRVRMHLAAVFRHNFKERLSQQAVLRAPELGCGTESGTVLCTWPKGGRPSLPFVYADEVWTGVEYEVASLLVSHGFIDEGLTVVRACRSRYDGKIRNPFSETEAGQWYARAMASYALLQAFSGARFDAVNKVLYLRPAVHGDFRCFLSTATGFGTVGVRGGQPFVETAWGVIPVERIDYAAKK